jgi:hypothetical protein
LVDYLNCHPRIRCRSEILNPHFEVYGNPRKMNRNRLRLHVEANFVKRPGIWAGAKILTYQLDEMDVSLWDILQVLRRPAVIVLYRQEVIEQFMSLKMAEHSNVWHSTKSGRACAIEADLDEFTLFAQREHRMWKTNFAALAAVDVLYLSYEQLAADPAQSMNKVFEFLQLPPVSVHSVFVKLNPQPLAERLTNYQNFAEAGLLLSTKLDLPKRKVASHAA